MLAYDGRTWDEPQGPEARGWSPLCRMYLASDRWFFVAGQPADRAFLAEVAGLDDCAEGECSTALERRFAENSAAAGRATD